MFANQPKESFKFEDEVLLPASSLQKKSLPDQQDLVQSASTRDKSSSKDIFDSTRSIESTRSTTGLTLSNQSNQKPYFGGFALSTKKASCESCHKMEYLNLSSQWSPSVYQKYDQRILTFNTWPKSHPIHPGTIARGGFIYTGRGDKVYCPWCQISLVEWETFDIPMDEHRRHSPNCEFILLLYPKV